MQVEATCTTGQEACEQDGDCCAKVMGGAEGDWFAEDCCKPGHRVINILGMLLELRLGPEVGGLEGMCTVSSGCAPRGSPGAAVPGRTDHSMLQKGTGSRSGPPQAENHLISHKISSSSWHYLPF